MRDRTYRIITVYDCERMKELTFTVNRYVEIPKLRRREKILLEIHLTMRGRTPMPIIKTIKKKKDDDECKQQEIEDQKREILRTL